MLDVCKECRAFEDAKSPFLEGVGVEGGIMIIGDAPTFFEDTEKHLFGGASAKWLYRELINVGIDMEFCYVTKAMKCYTPKAYTKAQIKLCREVLKEEVRRVKPSYILVLGAIGLDVVMGKSTISKNRGVMFEFEGAKVLATYNPNAVIKRPGLAWEFRSDLNYFSRMCEGTWKPPEDFDWVIIKEEWDYVNLLTDVENSDAISYDIEATSLHDTKDDRLLMIGIATRERVYILPMETDHRTDFVSKINIQTLLRQILGKSKIKKVAQNAKFDNRWLRNRGIEAYVDFDTFLASYLLNVTTPHGLKYMAKTYLGATDYDEGIEFKKDLSTDEFEKMAKYCALDCYYTLKLYDILKKALLANQGLARVFKYIVMPGERVLQEIETKGAYVSKDELKLVTSEYEASLRGIDEKIEHLLPPKWKGKINLNSPKQLAELLFEDLGLPSEMKTPTGNDSTGKSSLLRLVEYHELPKLILERRTYDKALNGFLYPWKDYIDNGDGRLHTTYNIAKTATGRLSASDPNLQQVPRDKRVRNLISAPKGRVFIEADYSQLELRVAAFIANAGSMKDAFKRGEDIHTKTASSVSYKRPEDVTKADRTKAKAVNFGERLKLTTFK